MIETPAPNVFLHEFGDSAVIYELRVWMRHARLYNQTCDEIRSAMWYEFHRRGMRVPFPIRTLERRTPNVPVQIANARRGAAEIVGSGSVLDCLTKSEAAGLVERGRISLFGRREALVRRGEKGNSMFVILDGSVEVVGKSEEGPRVILAKMGPGECFGERSLLTGEPRNATVRAESDTLVLEIRKDDLSPFILENPELAERLADLLARREREWHEILQKSEAERGERSIQSTATPRSLTKIILRFFGQGND